MAGLESLRGPFGKRRIPSVPNFRSDHERQTVFFLRMVLFPLANTVFSCILCIVAVKCKMGDMKKDRRRGGMSAAGNIFYDLSINRRSDQKGFDAVENL